MGGGVGLFDSGEEGVGVGFVVGTRVVGLAVASSILVDAATGVVGVSMVYNELLLLDGSRQHIKYPVNAKLSVHDAIGFCQEMGGKKLCPLSACKYEVKIYGTKAFNTRRASSKTNVRQYLTMLPFISFQTAHTGRACSPRVDILLISIS